MCPTTLLAALLLSTAAALCNAGNALHLRAEANPDNTVLLTISGVEGTALDSLLIYRSFNNIATMSSLDLDGWAITKTTLAGAAITGSYIDSFTAHHTTYTYYVKGACANGTVLASNVATVSTPDILLPAPTGTTTLFIDKVNYFIELRFGGHGVKRFPVNTGSLPQNRKLHYDLRSTPEGEYAASSIRPKTDYHKAIGISYPNATDRLRYKNALSAGRIPSKNGVPAPIGGSIQIHGGGIGNNWTWGCIAMRNSDLDALFNLSGCKTGLPITIVGSEFTRNSIQHGNTIKNGPAKKLYSLQ